MSAWIVLGAGLALLAATADPPVPSPVPAPVPPPATADAPTVPILPPAATSLLSGQMRGSVSYGRHEPAAGVIVLIRPEGQRTPLRVATTGTNGAFAFDGLPDGTYQAEVRRDGYLPVLKTGLRVKPPFRAIVEVILVPGATPKRDATPLQGTASFAGTIRIAGGAPVAEARLRLTRPDGGDDARIVMTDATGAFSIKDMRAGRWHLDLQGAGLLPLRADFDLTSDVTVEAQLAPQPANYHPLPQDLLLPEEAIPPAGP